MCALRTTRALPNGIGRAARCSLLRPGYFGGDEAALQQHSNDATFRRRSFREWPRAPTHSGRRLTREAFSIFIVRRADFRRLQTLSVPVPFKVISKRTGFDRALEFNNIWIAAAVWQKILTSNERIRKNSIDCRSISSAALWPQPGLRACTSGTHAPA